MFRRMVPYERVALNLKRENYGRNLTEYNSGRWFDNIIPAYHIERQAGSIVLVWLNNIQIYIGDAILKLLILKLDDTKVILEVL